ncbi:MAG: hypothetical protein CEO21_117 [Microgenomates group bacterium Gr01-1014_80]|nr:MAG: hypothetical protein CEO21_117 [Microgenomates group bacterium Gr01-1014_80]
MPFSGSKENLVEFVSWHKQPITNAAFVMGHALVRNVDPDQSFAWHAFRDGQLLPTIKTERPIPISFRAEGYEFSFTWSTLRVEEGRYADMWFVEEPVVRLFDRSWGELTPSGRNRLYQTTKALMRGMEDSYGLTVVGQNPITFRFPKEYYASLSTPVKAILLESPN